MMPNFLLLSAISDPDGLGMIGITVVLGLSAHNAVHLRYLTVDFLQRHLMAHLKGRGVGCLF